MTFLNVVSLLILHIPHAYYILFLFFRVLLIHSWRPKIFYFLSCFKMNGKVIIIVGGWFGYFFGPRELNDD